MALNVVPTNKVYESCSAGARPPLRALPSGAQSWGENPERSPGAEPWSGPAAGRRIAGGGLRNQEVRTEPVCFKVAVTLCAVRIPYFNYNPNRIKL